MLHYINKKNPNDVATQLDDVQIIAECATVVLVFKNILGTTCDCDKSVLKWATRSKSNYQWMVSYWGALITEHSIRFNEQHKSTELFSNILDSLEDMPEGELQTYLVAL